VNLSRWLCVSLTAASLLSASAASAAEPRRIDHGDLIVLEVYGSYQEMGRQIGELLGEDGRRVLDLNLAFYRRAQPSGFGAWFFDRVTLPLAARFLSDDTGVMDEAAGLAEALGVPRSDFLRSQIGAGTAAGSTVLAATRAATADGNALLARNVDWIDFGGLLKPTVIHYHPDNGDQEYLSAGWPLLQIPTVGINESGLAFSLNYFETRPQMEPTSTSYPYRRVLQRARTVDEAIALFQAEFPLVLAAFGVVADAAGDLALLECTTTRCEVFRPEDDWFAHSNHARTEPMRAVDRFRGPDSLDRRRLMEAAFAPHAGRLDAARAAEILRNREGHAHANASIVGNLFVLNAAIVEPARRVLWHSDRIEPYAPFGSYVPLAIEGHGAGLAPIPAADFLQTDAYREESQAVARVRAALNAHFVAGDLARANALWAEILAAPPTQLEVSLLGLGQAYSLLRAEQFPACVAALDAHVGREVSHEVRTQAALIRGACEDGQGKRERALARYEEAAALADEVPDYTSYDAMRDLATTGRERPLAPEDVVFGGWLAYVPP
jgi:hypothetical protein